MVYLLSAPSVRVALLGFNFAWMASRLSGDPSCATVGQPEQRRSSPYSPGHGRPRKQRGGSSAAAQCR